MQASIIVGSSSDLMSALLELSNSNGGIIKVLPSDMPYVLSYSDFGPAFEDIAIELVDADSPVGISLVGFDEMPPLSFDGVAVTTWEPTDIAPENVLAKLAFEDGQVVDESAYAKTVDFQGEVTDNGTFLLDSASKIIIPREQLRGQQDFTVALSLNPGEALGTFFDMHTQVRAWVTDDGAVSAFAKTDAGMVVITTAPGLVNDGDWHRIALAFDGGADGAFSLFVDGVQVATAEVSGELTKMGTYPPVIGNTWGDSIHAEVSDVELQVGAWSAEAAAYDHLPDVPVSDAEPDGLPPEAFLAKLTFADGEVVDDSIYGKEVVVEDGKSGGVTETGTFLLDGSSKIIVAREQMRGQQDFAVALSLKPGEAKGTFFDMHTQVRAWVTADGAVSAFAKTDNGMVVITTAAGLVNDGDWHRIGLSFDGGEDGVFTLYVDGLKVAAGDVSGELSKMGTYPPVIGNTWGKSIQAEVSDIEIQSEPWTEGQPVPEAAEQPTVPVAADEADQVADNDADQVTDSDVDADAQDAAPSVPSETDGAREETGEEAGVDEDTALVIEAPVTAPADLTIPNTLLNWLGDGASPIPDAAPEKVLADFDGVTITVSNDAELADALARLGEGSGGRILLVNTGVDYSITGKGLGHASENILITSADPEDPAVVKLVDISGAKNLTFDNLQFNGHVDSGSGKVVTIYSSSDIVVSNSLFFGSSNGFVANTEDNVDTGRGSIMVRLSTEVQIIGNEFSHMGGGIGLIDSTGTVVKDNDLHHLVYDGLQMAGVVDTVIENNVMHDFYYSTQDLNHSDFIQLFSASWNTMSTENLIIRGNQLINSGGYGSQSIFMRNEDYERGDGERYRNIVVEDNTILNGHQNAVFIGDANGVSVANNTVLWNPDAMIYSTVEI